MIPELTPLFSIPNTFCVKGGKQTRTPPKAAPINIRQTINIGIVNAFLITNRDKIVTTRMIKTVLASPSLSQTRPKPILPTKFANALIPTIHEAAAVPTPSWAWAIP